MTNLEEINLIQGNLINYKEILNKVPAIIYINEYTKRGDSKSLRNVWSNQYACDFIGYTREEITEMGFDFFVKTLHPDDLEIISKTIELSLAHQPGQVFTFMHRMVPKGKTDYYWLYGNGMTLEVFKDGSSKKSLSVVLEIKQVMHTENQLTAALKEIEYLKNALSLKLLTKREKEMLGFITKGLTDKEIGAALCISQATSKTHRNNLIKKLHVKNTASLASFAARCGIY
jgi:DNA-binding CsgD family transcriptional regulator